MKNTFLNSNNSQKKRGNLLLAAMFFAIALIGLMMMINNPPTENLNQGAINDTIRGSTQEIVGHQEGKEINFFSFLVKTLLITGIIIVLILMAARFIRMKGLKNTTFGKDIKIVGRRYLSPKQYILIVDVYGKKLLLGVTEYNITKLDEFEIQDESFENNLSDADDSISKNVIEKINLKKRQDDQKI